MTVKLFIVIMTIVLSISITDASTKSADGTILDEPVIPCEQYKQCVECRIFQTGNASKSEHACDNACSGQEVIGTSKFDVEAGETLCAFIDDDECTFQFKYATYEDFSYVIAETTKQCNERADIISIIFRVFVDAIIVSIGPIVQILI